MTGNIPESIKCKLCGEVCKRGVSLGCCDTIACIDPVLPRASQLPGKTKI